MAIDRGALRWNGWGFRDRGLGIGRARTEALRAALGERLGGELVPGASRAATLEEVRVPPSRLPAAALEAFAGVLGDGGLAVDDRDRAVHAAGKSLVDLFRLRAGDLGRAPDAVLYPRTPEMVADLLRAAARHRVAVVPFGGGSSVVGGVEPLPGDDHVAVVTLDTTRLDGFLGLDETSGTARFQAGIDGPALEAALAERGFTLGHFPQSFEHSTLGGWIAARSSGQQSDGYGGIEDLVVAVRMVTPEGELRTLDVPRRAAGPELRELVVGSEGLLGVVVEATLRVRRKPAFFEARGMLFRRFEEGTAAVRAIGEAGLSMTMMRLSDAAETDFGILLQRDPARSLDPKRLALDATRLLGYGDARCLLLYAVEGDEGKDVLRAVQRAGNLGREHGGLPLGAAPARSWIDNRFHTPYLRDWLLDHGAAIETLETAFPWSRLDDGHVRVTGAIRRALEAHAGGGIAMGHLSHSYRDGACLYFIVVYRYDVAGGPDRAIAQWSGIKGAAMDAVVEAGGTVSHHHGVGTDHRPWLAGEVGDLGLEALRALKRRLDPFGIMNPHKVL